MHKKICEFFSISFENRFETSTKAFSKEVWSLLYLANIFSECNNSNIKRLKGSKASKLVEMREILNRAEERYKINQDYIKTRKIYNAVVDNVLKLMKQFRIEKTIAESIAGSIQKLKRLKCKKTRK